MAIMDDEEEYFPRGGSSKNQKKSLKSDRSYIVSITLNLCY